jgi:hypothetical protein
MGWVHGVVWEIPGLGPQGGIFRSGGKDWAFLTWAALWAEHVLCVRVVSEAPGKKRKYYSLHKKKVKYSTLC